MIQFHHVLPLQIRFNDVDKFGHVNNTVYFQFYDTAKTDYIASVCKGVDWERLAIVVVKIDAEFVAQIKANDHIAGRTRVVKIGNKSFHLEQDVIDVDTQEVKSRCFPLWYSTTWNISRPSRFLTNGATPLASMMGWNNY